MNAHVDTAAALRGAAARLQELPVVCEAEFVRVGDALTAAVGAVGRVQSRMGDLRDALIGDDMRRARDALTQGAARIATLLGGATAGRASLADLQELIGKAQQRLTMLIRVLGEIGVIAVNAQIQAAQVAQAGVDFTVFTRDIARLQRLAHQAVERCRESLGALAEAIAAARANLARFDKEHAASLDEARSRLAEGVARLQARDQRTARLIDVINAKSKEIAAGVSGAVAGLQINDITMQRADHVREALEILAGAVEKCAADGKNGEGRERLTIAAACRLQALQLNRAGADFVTEVDKAIADMIRLSRAAGDLTAEAANELGGESDGGASIHAIEHNCDRVAAFLQAFRRTEADMRRTIDAVSSGVSSMQGDVAAIHHIESDMRIMGLNATLKCGRLGDDGRALAVIAQELRVYSRQIGEETQAIIALMSQAAAIGANLSAGDGDHDAEAAALEDEMRQAQGILSRLNADLAAGMAAAQSDGAAAAERLIRTAEGVTMHKSAPERLRMAADSVEAQAVALDPERRGDGGFDADIERLLGRNYTMEGERTIRAQFAVGAAGKAGAPAATADIEEFFL